MLSNLKIRNKLILILAAPVVALVVLAGIGASQRRSTASGAQGDTKIIQYAQEAAAAAHAAEAEGALSVSYLAGPTTDTKGNPKVRSALVKQRKATDLVMTRAVNTYKKLGPGSLSSSTLSDVSLVLDVFQRLNAQRSLVDSPGSEQWTDAYTTYSGIATGWLKVVQDLPDETSTPAVVSSLQGFSALANQSQAQASLSILASGVVLQGKWFVVQNTPGATKLSDGINGNKTLVSDALDQVTLRSLLLQSTAPAISDSLKSAVHGSQSANVESVTNLLGGVVQSGSVSGSTGVPTGIDPNDHTGNTFSVDLLRYQTSITTDVLVAMQQNRNVEIATGQALEKQTANLEHKAQRAAQLYILFAGLVVLIALALAFVVARSITRPVNKLTSAAHRLSREQLPRLVDSLKNPAEDDVGYLAASFTPIDVEGRDEVGQLADAFNGIQEVAVNVATEQASLLRKGIGDMFVNLARRNQTLLDRQIEFIDQLESKEEDPDQLENLFRLDHLATRMRRNAESLLVLAGAEPNRRRGKPVPLADVVRAAVGEVEDFARIDMLQFDEVLVASNAALDIAHLLSELMENAANFSPPDTRVEVVGHRTKAEGYVISIADHGIGMSPEQLNEANELLSRPPLVGLALSRSLGFIVIGRLASRFGIAVRLMPSPSGGTTAMVSLPATLITDQPKTPSGPGAIKSGGSSPELPSAPDDLSTLGDSGPVPSVGPDARPAPAATAVADPASLLADAKAAEQAPPSAPRRKGETPPRAPRRAPASAGTNGNGATAKAAPTTPPANGSTTGGKSASGLTKRVPRAAGGERAVPGGEATRAATTTRRSPDEVRSMLSNYRSGMQRGRSGDDATPTSEDTEK